jgi:hypothetical protein
MTISHFRAEFWPWGPPECISEMLPTWPRHLTLAGIMFSDSYYLTVLSEWNVHVLVQLQPSGLLRWSSVCKIKLIDYGTIVAL